MVRAWQPRKKIRVGTKIYTGGRYLYNGVQVTAIIRSRGQRDYLYARKRVGEGFKEIYIGKIERDVFKGRARGAPRGT